MSNSADKLTATGGKLDQESDVIELTDEVDAPQDARVAPGIDSPEEGASRDRDGQVMEDELDLLTREMPEFRMPEVDAGGAAPAAAIITGRRRARSTTRVEAAQPTSPQDAQERADEPDSPPATAPDAEAPAASLAPDEAAEARAQEDREPQPDAGHAEIEAEVEADVEAEVGYDRQEMVKTIQMRAVDRDEMEQHYWEERLKQALLLEDHYFAPDILIREPRALVTRWQEGAPRAHLNAQPLEATGFDHITAPLGEEEDGAGAQTLEERPAPGAALGADAATREAAPHRPDAGEPEKLAPPDELDADDVDAEDFDGDFPADDFDAERNDESISAASEHEIISDVELELDAIELDLDELGEARVALPPPQPQPLAEPAQRAPERPTLPPRLPEEVETTQETDSGSLIPALQEQAQAEERERQRTPSAPAPPQKRQPQRPRSPRDSWVQKVFTEEYLRTLPTNIHQQTRRDVDFMEASLELTPTDRVLDLACGFGRHSIELTRRGYEVVGLDLSMPLLQKALNEAQRQELSIKFLHGDMRELNFDNLFSACFLWQTSFGYFDDQTNFLVLRGIHRALRDGGKLLIDVLNRDHIVPLMPHRLWWEGMNCVFLEEVEFDYRTSVLHAKRSFIYEDGTPPMEQSSYIRLYSAHELRQILQAAGFVVTEVSGELHHPGQFLGPASTRIVIRAQKRTQKGAPK